MSKLKGRLISKDEAVADINKYLGFRDLVYDRIINMIKNDTDSRVSQNGPLKQYFTDDETSFFFSIEMLEKLIKKGKDKGANCIRIYYGAAEIPVEPASKQLFNELGIQEGSSTLVLVPCVADIDAGTGEINKLKNVIANDGEDGGQWPGGSSIPLGSRVGSDLIDETLPTDLTIAGSSFII
jgi:hypothetical protein